MRNFLSRTEGKVVFLATASGSGKPNVVSVFVNFFIKPNKILFSHNMLNKTLRNLKENSRVAFALQTKEGWFQFKGVASIFKEGKYFEKIKTDPSNKDYSPKSAILIEVKEIFDLDKGKKVGP